MASDYSPPRLVKPTPGGNPGDGSMNGALTTQADTPFTGNTTYPILMAFDGRQNVISWTPSDVGPRIDQTVRFLGSLVVDGGGMALEGPTAKIYEYLGVFTLGHGVSPIYGLGQRVTVAATTSPGTTITTFTPGATGSCKVHVTIKNKDTTSVTANVLVSYTDPDVGAQTVLIINGVSIGASGIASATFVLDSTATAITVSAYGSVANELVCTADIEQFA